jgi:putative membrane protein
VTAVLKENDRERISAAVTVAESTTSGEIVTIIADQSDGYSDVAFAWSAVVAFTALLVLTLFPDFYLGLVDRVLGNWAHDWSPREIFALAMIVAIAKFLGMWLLQLWRPLKFLLIPGSIKTHRTLHRAIDLFKVGAERRTTGRTGILIYLSMRERRAQIIADEAIASKVPAETWGEAMAAMLAHIKDGRIADGMCAAVEKVGVVLTEHFSRAEDDVNELPDRLIEL